MAIARFEDTANPTLLNELRKSALGFFVLFLALYAASCHWQSGFLYDAHRFVVGRDFLNLWAAGKIGLGADPGSYYDPALFMKTLHALLGAEGYWDSQLSYTPLQFLLGIPFAALPYLVALPLWLVMNAAALYFAARPLLGRDLTRILLLSPPALVWLLCGQSSGITAALILTAFRLRDEAPVRAGIAVGLLAIKPQLAILFPLYFLITRRWRSVAAATFTVLALVALSIAVHGIEPWIAYWRIGIPAQVDTFLHPSDMVNALSPTLYNDLHLLGLPPAWAAGLQVMQVFVAGSCLIAALRRWPGMPLAHQILLFVTASLIAAFYVMSYDLLVWAACLLLVMRIQPLTRGESWLFALCFWLPLLDMAVNTLGLAGASLLPVIVLIWLLRAQESGLHRTGP